MDIALFYMAEIEKSGDIVVNAKAGGTAMDEQLLGLLKDLRKKIAKQLKDLRGEQDSLVRLDAYVLLRSLNILNAYTLDIIKQLDSRGTYWPITETINLQVFPRFSSCVKLAKTHRV